MVLPFAGVNANVREDSTSGRWENVIELIIPHFTMLNKLESLIQKIKDDLDILAIGTKINVTFLICLQKTFSNTLIYD